MDSTTTTTMMSDEELAAMSAADAPIIPPRKAPRRLTMTDKIVAARDLSLKKAERLTERADKLRQELARCVAELNETRAEVGRGNATLPAELRKGGDGLTFSGGPRPDPIEQSANGAESSERAAQMLRNGADDPGLTPAQSAPETVA